MSTNAAGYGVPRQIDGKGVSAKGTVIPNDMLCNMASVADIPITISGANQVTFTVNASKTNPVNIWNGNDFIQMKETLAYTWTNGSNNILDANGAASTVTASTKGVWYFYIGLTSAGALSLLPSMSAPSYVQGPYPGGVLTHPGTTRAQDWTYVGYHVCTTAATPVFLAATKYGKIYSFAAQSVATTATWALLDFSETIPGHGVKVGGYLETGAAGTVTVGPNSTDSQGGQLISESAAGEVAQGPFFGIPANSAGKIYAKDTVARGDVHITMVEDKV